MSYVYLEAKINNLRGEPVGSISRLRELGEPRSFKEVEDISSRFVNYFDYIFPDKYKVLDDYVWHPVIRIVTDFGNVVENVKSINPNDPEFNKQRNFLIDKSYKLYSEYVSFVQGVISVSQYNEINEIIIKSESLQAQIKDGIDNANKSVLNFMSEHNKFSREKIDEIVNEYKEKLSSIDSMMESVKVKSEQLFAQSEAKYFSDASDVYDKSSKFWLASSILVSIISIVMASLMLQKASNGFIKGLSQNEIIVYMSTKAFIFSIICYLLSKCIRSYFAAKHNYSINNHRSNAILSYRALHELTKESEKRDEILSAVANAVFSPQDSAYVKVSANSDVPTAIINSISGGVKDQSS